MALMAVLASAGPFIYMRLQRRIESRLRAQEFKSHEALRRLSHNMLRFTNLEVLLKLVVHYLVKILRLRFAGIYLLDSQADKYLLKSFWQIGEDIQLPESFSKDSPLLKDLNLRRLPIITEEIRLLAPKALFSSHIGGLFNTLSNLKINTIIPSFLRNGLLGFLILSDRKTNLTFSQEDINLLMVLSNEAALAIENAQFHQKEKSILAEKSRREALADMAPGASHQFNNRLAVISATSELLEFKLESLGIDTIQDEKIRDLLKDTKEGLARIAKEAFKGKEITSAILKRAKAKTDFHEEVDIVQLIENAYRLVLISRSKSGLEEFKEPLFKLTLLNEIPKIFGSEALLQDCFYNKLDNAFDAIQTRYRLIQEGELPKIDYQGKIEVILSREGEFIIIQFKDNGIGLTKENQRKLFTPYFTTKATSGKGTGLGLYVIRDFIELHGGTITCDSEYGFGTTFTIRLPIKKERVHKTNVQNFNY